MGKTNEHTEARGDNMSYAFPCVALTRLVLAKPWRLVVSSEGDLHQNSSKDCFHASSSLVLNLGKSMGFLASNCRQQGIKRVN